MHTGRCHWTVLPPEATPEACQACSMQVHCMSHWELMALLEALQPAFAAAFSKPSGPCKSCLRPQAAQA